jgi:hypothetical protein
MIAFSALQKVDQTFEIRVGYWNGSQDRLTLTADISNALDRSKLDRVFMLGMTGVHSAELEALCEKHEKEGRQRTVPAHKFWCAILKAKKSEKMSRSQLGCNASRIKIL